MTRGPRVVGMIPNVAAIPARPVILFRDDGQYLDRHSLAALIGRSVETIRRRCPVAFYYGGKAVYHLTDCERILDRIPARRVAA